MIKRKRLGQHFLTSNSIAKSIVSEAKITKNDIVFEIGTGQGILTPLLCQKSNKVISVDMDEELIRNAKSKFSDIDNLVLKSGDGFKKKEKLMYMYTMDETYKLAENLCNNDRIYNAEYYYTRRVKI